MPTDQFAPALAADARALHRDAVAALADGGRRVAPEVTSALRPDAREVPTACAWGAPLPCALAAPSADPLPSTYRVIFDRWFGSPLDGGTRMVEVTYRPDLNLWVLTRDVFFPRPTGGHHSRNGSAQGEHRGALRTAYASPVLPVPPGHLRTA